jgi:glutamate decarboxylase
MLSVMTRRRIDRVFALFAPSQATLAAERSMDERISVLIADFLRTKGVTAPTDLATLAEGFADTELPDEPMEPAEFIEHLAEDVVPYSNHIASSRCLAHMNQGLPYFMRPLAKLVTALNQNMTKLDASRALSLCERQALAAMHRLAYDLSDPFYDRHV